MRVCAARWFLVLLLFCLVFSGVAAAAEKTLLEEIIARGTVRVGMVLTMPGYAARGPSGEAEGYDVEIARNLAKTLGVKLEIVEVTGPTRVPSLAARKVDAVIANFTRTLERAKVIDFTNPYMVVVNRLLVLATSNVKTYKDLNNKARRIGISRGGTSEQTVPAVLPEATIVRFDSYSDELLALRQGKTDAASEDNIFCGTQVRLNPGLFRMIEAPFPPEEISIGVPKGEQDWLNWLNFYVHTINATGQNAAWHDKWLKAEPAQIFVLY